MARKITESARRSGCPLNASVEVLGDRWSLLIIRDMMLRGFRTFKEFLGSYERIATNILTDRLRKLEEHEIIRPYPDPADGRRLIYRLTEKGIDLAPVLTEMVLWAAAHEETENEALVKTMQTNRVAFLAGIRRRWEEENEAMAKGVVAGAGGKNLRAAS
jgi:DNA-binding HxlR family transcriptional regulator